MKFFSQSPIVARVAEKTQCYCGIVTSFWKMATSIAQIFETIRGRRMLTGMDARMHADIGVSIGEAEHEANRKFWDRGPRR